jgi:glycosyltransferase involved in cell wall biosynthesis
LVFHPNHQEDCSNHHRARIVLLKILHLSTFDRNGGAAHAAHRLHTGLRRLSHDSSMLVADRHTTDPTVKHFIPPMDPFNRLRRRLRHERITRSVVRYRVSRPEGHEPFNDDRTPYGAALLDQLPACDVVNLHWIARFVDYRSFFGVVPQQRPVVWTLHDMNPFSGGCHYDDNCGKFVDRCGACPQLGSSDPADISRRIWQRKRNIFQQIEPGQLHIVAPSRWMAAAVKSSSLLGGWPVAVIPCGLDIDVFAPRDRYWARGVWGVPRDARVILFAADSVDNRRKGFALLNRALADLKHLTNIFLLSVGRGSAALDSSFPHLHLGYIRDDELSSVYSAADVLVVPSLQESFGLTVLEALACGTPVVAFAIGGIPDMVRHRVTGMLVSPLDTVALSSAIGELLQDRAKWTEMSANCRRIAVEEYSLGVHAQRYVELYKQVLAQRVV